MIPNIVKIAGQPHVVNVSGRGYVTINGLTVELDQTQLLPDKSNWTALMEEAFALCVNQLRIKDLR